MLRARAGASASTWQLGNGGAVPKPAPPAPHRPRTPPDVDECLLSSPCSNTSEVCVNQLGAPPRCDCARNYARDEAGACIQGEGRECCCWAWGT
jgi:hypothetical protein